MIVTSITKELNRCNVEVPMWPICRICAHVLKNIIHQLGGLTLFLPPRDLGAGCPSHAWHGASFAIPRLRPGNRGVLSGNTDAPWLSRLLVACSIGWVRNSESWFLGEEGSLLVHRSTAVADLVRGMPGDVE